MADESHDAGNDVVNLRNELSVATARHAEELRDLRDSLEAKHEKEFEALRLLWDKDRDELRRLKEAKKEMAKEEVGGVVEKATSNSKTGGIRQRNNRKDDNTSGVSDGEKTEELVSLREINQQLDLISGFVSQERLSLNERIIELEGKVATQEKEIAKANKSTKFWHDQYVMYQPLAEIGILIRLRCWELSRTVLYSTRREDLDQKIIKEGNEAAHRGNIEADLALLDCHGFAGGSGNDIFERIYRFGGDDARSLIERGSMHVRLWSTVASLDMNIPSSSPTRYHPKWVERRALWDKLLKQGMIIRSALGAKGAAPASAPHFPDFESDCSKLEELTEELLEIQRSDFRRR